LIARRCMRREATRRRGRLGCGSLETQAGQCLLGGLLLGGLLRLARANAELLAFDHGCAPETTVVRRPLHVEDGVIDGLTPPRKRLLQLGLVVDVRVEGVLDSPVERADDRLLDLLEAVLQEEGGEGGLQQGGEDVAVAREPVELIGRDLRALLEQTVAEVELARDDRAARARNDVRADLRQPALREVRVALEERTRDRELEHAVAEELEALVRGRALARPGGMRVDLLGSVTRKLLDQLPELVYIPFGGATGARRRSRRPARRSGSSGRLRRRS
jgi:hypothetical protein